MEKNKFEPEELVINGWSSKPSGGFSIRVPNGVEIIHLPTGSIVRCDSERSQHRNRERALERLAEVVAALP